jgi:HK97 family phage major capsid protein
MTISVGTGGVPVYLPAGGLSASPYSSLFGRPVIPVEYCATVGDLGDIALVDLGQYQAIDKGVLKTATSIHVRFDYNETAFRFVFRFDGQPAWKSALTPFKGSNTLSPFVALAERA